MTDSRAADLAPPPAGSEPPAEAAGILGFWFGPSRGAEPGEARDEWFRKDAAFDAEIARRFGSLIDRAIAGSLDRWAETPEGALALVLLLDQFTRNVHRGAPEAFAGDERALTVAQAAVANGLDRRLGAHGRWFLYLPFEHSELLAVQKRSVELFTRLRDETGLAGPLEWAWKHYDVIARFGRYPHRNALLGRTSTEAERAFLALPGSAF